MDVVGYTYDCDRWCADCRPERVEKDERLVGMLG